MNRRPTPDFDVSVVIRTCDDEERIGHVIVRIARHLRSLEQHFQILVADEGSGDNTLAVVRLLFLPDLEVIHAEPDHGFEAACFQARGRAVLLYDARTDASLALLGFALGRLRKEVDVVAMGSRYLVFKRTRAWRAFEGLVTSREPAAVERGFLRRAAALGLKSERLLVPRARCRLREAFLGAARWRRQPVLGTPKGRCYA